MAHESQSQLIYTTEGKILRNDHRTWPILRISLSIYGVDEGYIDVSVFSETQPTHAETIDREIRSDSVMVLSHGPVCHATLHLKPVGRNTLAMFCRECGLRITTSKEVRTIRHLENYLRIRYGR